MNKINNDAKVSASKNSVREIKTKNVKNLQCAVCNTFLDFKQEILELKKLNKLNKFRFDLCYPEVMKNKWLIDDYICRYGVIDESDIKNSLSAYKKAVEKNYPLVIPVQVLKDDEVVCIKDKTLGDSTGLDGYVTNLSYDEIKDLTLYKSDEKIPTLSQVLEIVQGKTPIIIEIWNEQAIGKVENAVAKLLDAYCSKFNCPNLVAIESMTPNTLSWFYNNHPWYTRIIKTCFFEKHETYAGIKTRKLKKLKLFKESCADFVFYESKNLPNRYIKHCKPAGVIAYNVTEQDEYERVIKYCDNIVFSGFTPQI